MATTAALFDCGGGDCTDEEWLEEWSDVLQALRTASEMKLAKAAVVRFMEVTPAKLLPTFIPL